MARVLVLAATTAYQTGDLVAAAGRLGVEVTLGTNRCHVLAELWPEGSYPLDFRDPDRAAAAIARAAARAPVSGIVPTDETTAVIAALAARRLGLPHNSPDAARAAGDKLAFRRLLTAAGLLQPDFRPVAAGEDPAEAAAEIGFPVVIKPLHLSASRGVMRADSTEELRARARRLARLLAEPEVRAGRPDTGDTILVERYVPGAEVAFEGLVRGGALDTLAVFDKPDPLEGPVFPETLYVTPSIVPAAQLAAIERAVADAARALSLREGPVHAELRLGPDGPVVLELAARSIGGLCGRVLRFGAGVSLEEVVIAHAVGADPGALRRGGDPAAGVLMLPVPEEGVLRDIAGVDDARAIAGVRDVAITAGPGDHVVPLPEGHSYLGFVFAGGDTPDEVTASLRRAHEVLTPHIAKRL